MKEEILSAGIDIGTSTIQLVFTRITIENVSPGAMIPKVVIVDRKVVYRSDVYFTPLLSPTQIDAPRVKALIVSEFQKASIKPDDIDTGAVIITGETARKDNAKQVADMLSDFAGDFVVATAGPDLESIIAGKGAGSAQHSYKQNITVTNFDIGGGTTNIAVYKVGEVIDTTCLDIGGRLIKFEKGSTKVTYISEKWAEMTQRMGMPVKAGDTLSRSQVDRIVQRMVEILEEAAGLRPASRDLVFLVGRNTSDLKRDSTPDKISFSGGVAVHIYDTQNKASDFQYSDLGVLLGQAVRRSALVRKIDQFESVETIRATVIGAGSHATDISGSTINFTRDSALPLKNVPILRLSANDEEKPVSAWADTIQKKLNWFNLDSGAQHIGLAIKGPKMPEFSFIQELAEAIIQGLDAMMSIDKPLLVITEEDFAKVLGQTIEAKLRSRQIKKDVICIDSIEVKDGDYIDVGKPLAGGTVLPVIVKTLVFGY